MAERQCDALFAMDPSEAPAAEAAATSDPPSPAPPDFGDKTYWEDHYAQAAAEGEEVYDWLLGWRELGWLLEPLLGHDQRRTVLHLGCGNSALPEDFYDAGYQHQTGVDISKVVVSQMAERNRKSRPEMQWIAADCRNMADLVGSEAFSMVCDKSTLDALFCHEQHALAILEFVKEAFRVTCPGGVFISVSMHQPKSVTRWLRRRAFRWTVRVVQLEETAEAEGTAASPAARQPGKKTRPRYHYAYICAKQPGYESALRAHWPALQKWAEDHPDSDIGSSSEEADSEIEDEAAAED